MVEYITAEEGRAAIRAPYQLVSGDPEITVVHGRAGQGVTDTGILNWKKSRDPYACPLSWDHALQRNMLVHLKFIMKFLICTFVFV